LEFLKSAVKILLDNLLAIVLLVVGWLLGLVAAFWSQNRSTKLVRAEERRKRIYGPLYDELPKLERSFNIYASIDLSDRKEYQRMRNEHILRILDVPNELQERIEQLYEDKLDQFNEGRRTLLKGSYDTILEQLGIGPDGNRLASMSFHLLKEWSSLSHDDQSQLEAAFKSAKRNYSPTLLTNFGSAEQLFAHFKKDCRRDGRFTALTALRDESLRLVREIREEIRKDLKG